MKDRYNKVHAYDPFVEVDNPDIEYIDGNKVLSLYFIDVYPFKEEALENRIFHIKTEMNKFSVLLEKEIYDLVPDYYSKESLSLQCDYYGNVTRKNLSRLLLGGLLIGLATTFLLASTLIESVVLSSIVGLLAAFVYIIIYLNTVFQKYLAKGREKLRIGMIELLGEKRFKRINAIQEEYISRREVEIAKAKEEREKLEKEQEE
ncbi:hypothetical protein RJG79_00380 [Mycoplasmatota bacterium WC44]